MKATKYKVLFLLTSIMLVITACEGKNTVCTPVIGPPKPTLQLSDLLKLPPPTEANDAPLMVEIRGRKKEVDKLVDYPICNDTWSGTVYVNCDAQVATAELDDDENPLFFKGCNLKIEPNTEVYVAAHNDAPYYKGCSCHTGEDPVP